MDRRYIRHLLFIKLFSGKIQKLIGSCILEVDSRKITRSYYMNGCLNITTENKFYKIQLSGDSLNRTTKKAQLFKRCIPQYVLDYKILKNRPLCIETKLCYERHVPESRVEEIISHLRSFGKSVTFEYRKYDSINKGLDALCRCEGGVVFSEFLAQYFKSKRGEIVTEGVVHGDFHRKNVLFTESGDLVLIDFDMVRQRDIQEIDLLYYLLYENVYNHWGRITWYMEWFLLFEDLSKLRKYKIVENYIQMDLKLAWIILFVERIGGELQSMFSHDKKGVEALFAEITDKIVKPE